MESVFQDLIRRQRPHYLPIGSPIRGVDNQYWILFRHREAESLLKNLASFLGFGDKHSDHKLLRVDPGSATITEYTSRQNQDLPSNTLLRTAKLSIIEKFLKKVSTTKEAALQSNSFLGLSSLRRRFTLPEDADKYNSFVNRILERTTLYRRSTAFFDSGVLKLYEEPLRSIIEAEGQIRLLMDWQGFNRKSDAQALAKLYDPAYRADFIRLTLREFLQGLEEHAFNSTGILAGLVRLGFLSIKLIRMEQSRSIYHKKTGILTDSFDNHILHEGSDNFTRAAHTRNAESITFFYSHQNNADRDMILESIQQFDAEWENSELAFDLTLEFLQQVLQERERRQHLNQPQIDTVAPDEFIPGETTPFEMTGEKLDQIDHIEIEDDPLVQVDIQEKDPTRLKGEITIDPDHPPQPLKPFILKTPTGTYTVKSKSPAQVSPGLGIPEFEEIVGFKEAVELILSGNHGKPEDFLYWLAQQRPRQFRVERSDLLDELVNNGILYEHQKSGAQHCLRVMQDFGVAVCADAVGLGKTRLAAAAARLYRLQKGQAKIAIVAAKKLFPNWDREMEELNFRSNEYELYNKNLMSRKGNGFLDDFNRYGGPDLVIIDEAHEGIRNYNNRIHKTCLQIQEMDRKNNRQRHFLLLTATPWNNRREDIYNILSPFLSRPEGFTDLGFPPELAQWFQHREIGVENFTDDTPLFRRTYREIFLQRTRQMLRDATPDLNVYARREAEWLPVQFESGTEQALEQIFTQFESSLYIPFADPIRYLSGSVEQRSLLQNQRRFFLQRAESSMYALRRTISNFRNRIVEMQERLEEITPDADGLKQFLLTHYGFAKPPKPNTFDDYKEEAWDENHEEEDEDEEEDQQEQEQRRQQLRRSIDIYTEALRKDPARATEIHLLILTHCETDLSQLDQIQSLLAAEFLTDHKREQVTQKVQELVSQGQKVLLISAFSDTVIDYFLHMSRNERISSKGVGIAMGSTKWYFPDQGSPIRFSPNNSVRGKSRRTGLQRQELFRLFAPAATCRKTDDRPTAEEELSVLIGSETLSVGQNLQDADFLINIDLPWNPMVLEQRIGRIDRPKQHQPDKITVFYANSESQLLRQASRLNNLNKKLVGEDLITSEGQIQRVNTTERMGASVYGDTFFDDEVLPGYADFLQSLVKARKMEQINVQEVSYQKQEAYSDLYTQNEILHSEELSKRIDALGEDYQANPITLGRHLGETNEPTGLVGLTLQYFDPNGKPIPEQQRLIFWNDQTGERDGYGIAIATAFKTPEAGDIFSARHLLNCAQTLYERLVELKRHLALELSQPETLENVTVTSERISRIQRRITALDTFPEGVSRFMVKDTFKKLNAWKEKRSVQKLLREYTDGNTANLSEPEFLTSLIQATDELNLLSDNGAKPTSLELSLAAILVRA
ncbi:MAG: helicase [Synechococcaceae cyanobacterium SM2_3_2]|nr:helicase [Synechococcaceae cyanobacterium SM2_3_2]